MLLGLQQNDYAAAPNSICSNKKLLMQGFAQMAAAADDDEHCADDDAARQRVERPDVPLVQLEIEIEQELNEHVIKPREDERPAEDEEIPAADVPQQRRRCSDDEHCAGAHGQGKAQKPVPAAGEVYVQQIQRHGGKVHRDKDDRIRRAKP